VYFIIKPGIRQLNKIPIAVIRNLKSIVLKGIKIIKSIDKTPTIIRGLKLVTPPIIKLIKPKISKMIMQNNSIKLFE
jgi:hypothetical protein